MTRKHLVILLLCCTAVVVAAAVWFGIYYSQREKESDMLSTDSAGYAEDEIPHADPLIVGKWRNTDNPHWYKVYYDDFDEDEQLFWGKEWDESEDVHEEDLNYHGNGWFRWEKKGKELHEYATMDVRDIPIAKLYTLLFSTQDSLAYYQNNHKNSCFHFARVQ